MGRLWRSYEAAEVARLRHNRHKQDSQPVQPTAPCIPRLSGAVVRQRLYALMDALYLGRAATRFCTSVSRTPNVSFHT